MALYRAHILVDTSSPIYYESARSIMSALSDEIKRHGLDREVRVVETGHIGIHSTAPSAVVYPEGVVYTNLSINDAEEIVVEHLLKGTPVSRLLYKGFVPSSIQRSSHPRNPQTRVVMKNVGLIDPNSIDEYISLGGYEAAKKALTQMTSQDVIEEVKRSGLFGRSGQGVPTADKWNLAREAGGNSKSIICNGATGEPGNFKDSIILGGDPHSIIEGMLIGAYAVGADKGYICTGANYGHRVEYIRRAIVAARNMGLLGTDIGGSGFNFDIEIFEGTGDFICSEETALLESIGGRRGESRTTPPFPVTSGLMSDPTVIHCVETLANIPRIIASGADWFSGIGTEHSKGTKVYALSGDIVQSGVYEVPFGATLRDIVYNLAGGIRNGKHLKAILIGGPAGELVGRDDLDRQLCYEDLLSGSGALIVLDEGKCIISLIHNIVRFFANESCGLCTPCRAGTKCMLDILTLFTSGAGCEDDLEALKTLAQTVSFTSKCDIGRSSVTALLSSLSLFGKEFLSHAKDKVCLTGVCAMDK